MCYCEPKKVKIRKINVNDVRKRFVFLIHAKQGKKIYPRNIFSCIFLPRLENKLWLKILMNYIMLCVASACYFDFFSSNFFSFLMQCSRFCCAQKNGNFFLSSVVVRSCWCTSPFTLTYFLFYVCS